MEAAPMFMLYGIKYSDIRLPGAINNVMKVTLSQSLKITNKLFV